ncbi:vacuolar protein sorting-associated protein 45 [Monosporozyma unispora]|nr:vacuolar protein sorting-associated protein 45 [Kazachstania unispora]
MDLFKVGDYYVNRIVNSQSKTTLNKDGTGNLSLNEQDRIKVLLLDKNTTSTISMCATQSDLLEHEIYLVDTIENADRDIMRHLKCLVYVKPTDESIDCLVRELSNPKYGEYHLFFNNKISKDQLERLAEADDIETVVKVEEIFQDYQILNEHLFSLDLNPNRILAEGSLIWDEFYLQECTSNMISVLLSLKIRPGVIRYDSASKASLSLAKSIEKEIKKDEKQLFDFAYDPSAPSTLIILDRNDDPMTPLLQPWTYQSMIHEYIGIKRNMVDLSKVPNIDKDLEKVTLSSKQDTFFCDTMYLNFGELGDKVKQYVSNYKDKSKVNSSINSIDDIKEFIEKYPEIKKLSGNVSKHMALVGELDRQLKERDIWELSEVEQNLAVHKDSAEDYSSVLRLLQNPKLNPYYKLKLACIYMLRYDEIHFDNNTKNVEKISQMVEILKNFLPIEDINYLHKFRNFYLGKIKSNKNSENVETQGKDDLLTELAKKFNTRMDLHRNKNQSHPGSDNVYMQHIPKLSLLLSDLSKNNLSEQKYKCLIRPSGGSNNTPNQLPPAQDVVIFIVGGVTLEESRFINQFNKAMGNNRMRVILGGTSILSTKDFLESLR